MNNSKKITIAILVSVLLVLLFVGFKIGKEKNTDQGTNTMYTNQMKKEDESKEPKKETSLNGSIFDLIKSTNTVKCTYSSNDTSMQVSGTSYVSGNKMRTDSQVTANNTKMDSHMISDGQWIYTWSSAMAQGIKIKLETVTEMQKQPVKGDQTALKGFQDKFDFKCTDWTVDNSMFNVPTNIQFTDFSETMKNFTNPSGGSNMCAACNYAQDPKAKAECMVQFNCK